MSLPTRPSAAHAFIAATTLFLLVYPTPSEPEPPQQPDPMEPFPESVFLRIYAKDRIAREVAEGRRSLWDAATLFRKLDGIVPATTGQFHPIPFPRPEAMSTDDDAYCWTVIVWVWNGRKLDEAGSEERARVAVRRLIAQCEDELARRGEIRLPDPAALESVQTLLDIARAECDRVVGRQP